MARKRRRTSTARHKIGSASDFKNSRHADVVDWASQVLLDVIGGTTVQGLLNEEEICVEKSSRAPDGTNSGTSDAAEVDVCEVESENERVKASPVGARDNIAEGNAACCCCSAGVELERVKLNDCGNFGADIGADADKAAPAAAVAAGTRAVCNAVASAMGALPALMGTVSNSNLARDAMTDASAV